MSGGGRNEPKLTGLCSQQLIASKAQLGRIRWRLPCTAAKIPGHAAYQALQRYCRCNPPGAGIERRSGRAREGSPRTELAPISALTIVAKARGLFEKEGLDVSVSNFTSGKQALDTVIGGGADIATTAEAPVTAAAMAGQPIAFVAGMEYSDIKTLTAKKATIKSFADLKGKKIAYTAGTGSEVYTTELLKKAGLTTKDVTLVNLKPQEMLPALAAGSIDAYDTWEPHIANGRKALGDDVALLDTRGVYSETFNIVVMQDYLKANPQIVSKFLAALIAAEAWVKAHPEEAIEVVSKAVGMKPEDLKPIWSDYVYQVGIGAKQIDALKAHAQWRLDTKNHPPGVTGVPDFAVVLFPEPLRKLDAARVSYKLN